MSQVRQNIAYACRDTQEAIDAGLNGFAATLLAESYGDKPERFPEGGIMFVARSHKGIPVYITVSLDLPEVVEADAPPESKQLDL